MRPLGHIEDYKTFVAEFMSTLSKEGAVGFLFDHPHRNSLEKSGLTTNKRVVETMDELMSSKMSIYYLTPRKGVEEKLSDYRDRADRFNTTIIDGLNIKFKANYPCLIMFRHLDGKLTERTIIEFGGDSCTYFWDLHDAIAGYLHNDSLGNSFGGRVVNLMRKTYKSAKDDLPKTVLLNVMELSIGMAVAKIF